MPIFLSAVGIAGPQPATYTGPFISKKTKSENIANSLMVKLFFGVQGQCKQ